MKTRSVWRASLLLAVLVLIAMLLPLGVQAAPTQVWHYTVITSAPPNPGPGWGTVTQLLVGSGCNGTSCGSSWRPRSGEYEVLLEKSSDRVYKGHGEGDGTPPYVATVVYRRQSCPTDGAWAAGTWHHNFFARSRLEQTGYRVVQDGGQTHYYITLTQRWSSRYYQSFAHNDPCFSADPFPQPTPTPPAGGGPTPIATAPASGVVHVTVTVSVVGTPPSEGSSRGTGSGEYAPGAQVRATAAYPSAWDQSASWGGISYSGCGQSGASWQVEFAAPDRDCSLSFTIRFTNGGPPPIGTPTPAPNPCTSNNPNPDAVPPLRIAIFGVQNYVSATQTGSFVEPAWNQAFNAVLPGQPLAITYDLAGLAGGAQGRGFDRDHDGQAHIQFGLRDLTNGEALIDVDTLDRKELKDLGGQVLYWRRTLQIVKGEWAPGLSWTSPQGAPYAAFDRLHGGAFSPQYDEPRLSAYVFRLRPSTAIVTPIAGHLYEAWSFAGQGPCRIDAGHWSVARFRAGEGHLIAGQVWDITRPDAPIPATQAQHSIALEGSTASGGTIVVRQTLSSASNAAFALVLDRETLESFLRNAGYVTDPTGPVDLSRPIRFRLRFTPSPPYLPTTRSAEPPAGLSAGERSAFAVSFIATPAALLAQDRSGAAFYAATFPDIPVTARLFGWARSPHDGAASFVSTRSNADPARFSWMYAGVLEFYPDIALEMPAEWAGLGYRVEAGVESWQFHGSPPLGDTERRLSPREPVRVLWSKYPPPELQPPEVYAYELPALGDLRLAVGVAYSYTLIGPDGVPIGLPIQGTLDGQFTIALVATQVLDGGAP